MDVAQTLPFVPQPFLSNLKTIGYLSLLPIQKRTLETWFNNFIPQTSEDVQHHILNSMANNLFIASATGSGKTFSVILPLALEAFAGLDFVTLFVVPTSHLLAQTYQVLTTLFLDVASIKVIRAMDCLAATLHEDPSLFKLDIDIISELRNFQNESSLQENRTDGGTTQTLDDYLLKKFIESLVERLDSKTPSFHELIEYGPDKTSYFICGTPGIISALLSTIKSLRSSKEDVFQCNKFLKLRFVVIDETDHILLNDNTSFLSLVRELFAMRNSTAIFRVPQFFKERHRLGFPTDRFVFLSATMKYRVSLLENMGLHGGAIVDFNEGKDTRLALSPNVMHYVLKLQQSYSEVDITYLLFKYLCNPIGSITDSKTTLLPCIIFANSKYTIQRLAHLLFRIMMTTYKELRYKITIVSQTHSFKRPNFESVPSLNNDALVEFPATIVLATDSFARGLDLPAIRSVINYDLPESLATFTHRIGRCARGTNNGTAISLQRMDVEYQFDTLINFEPRNVISIDEEELSTYTASYGPHTSTFGITRDELLDISERFNENVDIYLTSLYDREFKDA